MIQNSAILKAKLAVLVGGELMAEMYLRLYQDMSRAWIRLAETKGAID